MNCASPAWSFDLAGEALTFRRILYRKSDIKAGDKHG